MHPDNTGGASVSARAKTPSLHLSRLCELLTQALRLDAEASPLLRVDAGRLHLNLISPLRALCRQEEFAEALAPGAQTGFLRDLELPPFGMSATLGGRLFPGSESSTTSAVSKLRQTISEFFDAALTDEQLKGLVSANVSSSFEHLAESLQVRVPKAPGTAAMVPVGFAAAERKADERDKDVARLFSAFEVVEGRDWMESLEAGIRNKLKRDDLDDEDIDPILGSLRQQRGQPGSQLYRFMEFMDEEALARVRLQVTFRLMGAVARATASPALRTYIRRVFDCHLRYAGSGEESLLLDASASLGLRSNTNLGEQLRKAMFYGCLPCWAEWSVQIFESRMNQEADFAASREVTYRFRVNGLNPESGKSAFAARLDRLESSLLPEQEKSKGCARQLAELVFLRLVVPASPNSSEIDDLPELASRLAADLKARPEETIRQMLADLRAREGVMASVASELIKAIRQKSSKLVNEANSVSDKFYIAVQRGIIDWHALSGMTSKSTEVLVKNGDFDEKIAWFQNITVTENPADHGALASYWVETKLIERAITPVDKTRIVSMERKVEGAALPVRFVPFDVNPKAGTRVPQMPTESFDFGCGVDVEYDTKTLTLKKGGDDKTEMLRAASCTAFAILAYIALWELARRARALLPEAPLSMPMLRLQAQGKDTEYTHGDAAAYAICQALERALSRELFVKLQGFHLQGDPATSRYRKTGAIAALQGGYPIRFSDPGSLEKVAVLAYATRPCDKHPQHPDADGYLFICRTYCADLIGDIRELRVDHMQSRLVESRKDFGEPHLVMEEVARLQEKGYSHIILLSHHYGNRNIGRAAERNAPHATKEFLEAASSKFPETFLYSLRRNVFPATRLRTRGNEESAFEASTFTEQRHRYERFEFDRGLLRGFQPAYTFATLAVVSESGRPQSGFCTYFFDDPNLSNLEWRDGVRQNILGTTPSGKVVQESLLKVLRGIHFLEAEKVAHKSVAVPVLDPYGWASPSGKENAGELKVMGSRRKGEVLLSFPAVLANVAKILHKDKEKA